MAISIKKPVVYLIIGIVITTVSMIPFIIYGPGMIPNQDPTPEQLQQYQEFTKEANRVTGIAMYPLLLGLATMVVSSMILATRILTAIFRKDTIKIWK